MSISSRLPGKAGTTIKTPLRAPTKPTPVGTDRALSLPTAKGQGLHLTYWDLWFVLIAVRDFNGDLLGLARQLAAYRISRHYQRSWVDRQQSHLLDLSRRLASAEVTIDQLIAAAGDLMRTENKRADKFILEQSARERDWSAAMRETPRQRHQEAALRGAWPLFPVSPDSFAAEVWSKFKTTGVYSENASFGVARKLDRFVERADKLLKKGCYAEAQALLRAWLTVVIELIKIADDSFGCIGDSFRTGFKTYLDIPLAETGIKESVFFPDLLDFLIWEDYGFTDNRTDGYFRKLTPEQADFCIAHLRKQIEQLAAELLTYQGENALTLLGQVVMEQGRLDQFIALAAEMGSREWGRIVNLVDCAMKKRKRELACQVFEAALTPGAHSKFLQGKYDQLKAGRWNPDPKK
jgi:hypothetical protein